MVVWWFGAARVRHGDEDTWQPLCGHPTCFCDRVLPYMVRTGPLTMPIDMGKADPEMLSMYHYGSPLSAELPSRKSRALRYVNLT